MTCIQSVSSQSTTGNTSIAVGFDVNTITYQIGDLIVLSPSIVGNGVSFSLSTATDTWGNTYYPFGLPTTVGNQTHFAYYSFLTNINNNFANQVNLPLTGGSYSKMSYIYHHFRPATNELITTTGNRFLTINSTASTSSGTTSSIAYQNYLIVVFTSRNGPNTDTWTQSSDTTGGTWSGPTESTFGAGNAIKNGTTGGGNTSNTYMTSQWKIVTSQLSSIPYTCSYNNARTGSQFHLVFNCYTGVDPYSSFYQLGF